jgi:hypothetical protein
MGRVLVLKEEVEAAEGLREARALILVGFWDIVEVGAT